MIQIQAHELQKILNCAQLRHIIFLKAQEHKKAACLSLRFTERVENAHVKFSNPSFGAQKDISGPQGKIQNYIFFFSKKVLYNATPLSFTALFMSHITE